MGVVDTGGLEILAEIERDRWDDLVHPDEEPRREGVPLELWRALR
ncbi:MAG: hypothetical protein WD250_13185 [Egibacteraceae bacterium]